MNLTFLKNVHLSEKFGSIKHGENLDSPDVPKGANLEIKNEKLAAYLIKGGFAKELEVTGSSDPVKPKGKKAKADDAPESPAAN